MTTGRVHEHLEIFEAEIEPKLRIQSAGSGGGTSESSGTSLALWYWRRRESVVYLSQALWEFFRVLRFPGCWKVVIAMNLFQTCCAYRTTGAVLPYCADSRAMWLLASAVFMEGANRWREFPNTRPRRPRAAHGEGIESAGEAAEEKVSSSRNKRT